MTTGARSIADIESGVILASVDIAAAPERVFRALTQSEEVVRWWGSDDTYRTTRWVADLRVGGQWRAEGSGKDGAPFFVEGKFLEVAPPLKLVQTWQAGWDPGATTTLTYRLEPIETGTRLIVRHEGFAGRPDSCRRHGQGWERVLNWLNNHFPWPPMAAPRPIFAA